MSGPQDFQKSSYFCLFIAWFWCILHFQRQTMRISSVLLCQH